MLKGSCLCGGVTFEVTHLTEAPNVCHCTQCRKQSGHLWAAVQVLDTDLRIDGPVRWYRSSQSAQRGFCPTCGSFLFWKALADPDTGVAMGAFDTPTGTKVGKHIFVADKGDYYELPNEPHEGEQET